MAGIPMAAAGTELKFDRADHVRAPGDAADVSKTGRGEQARRETSIRSGWDRGAIDVIADH